MRIFFLLLFFFMVHVGYGEEADGTKCELASVINGGGYHDIYVNKAFMANTTNCVEWQGHDGEYNEFMYINRDVTQELFNQTFKNVKKIKKLAFLEIKCNDKLTSLIFPELESVEIYEITFANCRNVKTISFPKLLGLHKINNLVIIRMPSLDASSIDNLTKKFVGEETTLKGFCDGSNIVDVSSLSQCKYLKRMNFAENTTGAVNSNITYVKEELKIVGTQLRNLHFLNLEPLAEKHNTPCVIVNNTFCEFDKDSVVKMLEGVYENCTIENNLDGECGQFDEHFS